MLTRETVIAVLDHYDLGALQDCRYIHRGVAGDSWWIETTTGQYFFKRRHSSRSGSQLVEAQHALVRHLRSKGFPAPVIIPTRHGASFLEYQGEVYEIHHIIPGDLCDVSKPAHLEAAARTLAWYHNAVQGFDHPGLHRPRERYGPNALREILDQLFEDWRGQTDAPLDGLLRQLEEHSRDLTARFDSFGELPELVIHADYYAENLIFQGDSVAGLVDYDLAHWSFRGMELAEALIYFAVAPAARLKHIVYSDVLDLDAIRRFLTPYAGIASLSESEIFALPHFIRMIWLCASLAPPLQPRLSLESAPLALPEILILADWAQAHAQYIIEIGLAAQK